MFRHKYLLIFSFSLLFQFAIFAQNDWVWVGPDSTSVSFVYAKADTVYIRNTENYRSIDGGGTWDLLDDTNPEFGGGYGLRAVYNKNLDIIYMMDYNRKPWKSTNGGISWVSLIPEDKPWSEEAWVKKLYVSPHNHNVLFLIVREGRTQSIDRLYRTTNSGITWDNLGAFLGSSHGNELYFAFDPVDTTKMYVSGYDNYLNSLFFASYDFGDNWAVLSSNFSQRILVDWSDNNRIYSFVFPKRSDDGGRNWVYINSGIFADTYLTSIIDPYDSSVLYMTTNVGIYKTTNRGEFWWLIEGSDTLGLNLSSGTYPKNLFIDSKTNKLYVGTGQGLYKYDLLVSVKDEKENIPKDFVLYQNYPNPFNPTTTIEYSVPVAKGSMLQNVSLIVYDLLGNEIVTLVNEAQNPGNYVVTFDASSTAGGLSSGIYYFQLKAGNFKVTKKMILLK